MKIAYLITRLDSLGGAQVHVRDLALAMARLGNSVSVITGKSGPFCAELKKENIAITVVESLGREISPWKDVRAMVRLLAILKNDPPDLLSLHSSKAGWLGRIVGRLLGVPVIFTAHGWAFGGGLPWYRSFFYRFLERITGSLSHKVITVCERDRSVAGRFNIVPFSRVATIHNGVHDFSDKMLASPENQPVRMVMTARFQEPKQHALLLQALGSLKELPWSLEFIGDGPMQEEVMELAGYLGLKDRVFFSGACLDVAERLSQAQIFVLLSDREGFPRSILEAMRAGLPVLASNVGGVREAIENGKTGFLVDSNDHAHLVGCLKKLLISRRLREQMGENARKVFLEKFTFDEMFEKTFKVYELVLREKGKAYCAGGHR